jgi:hypothetical protein
MFELLLLTALAVDQSAAPLRAYFKVLARCPMM